MHILLLGVYGSGKSTVGKLLAADLQGTFIEMDNMIHDATGVANPQNVSPVQWKECQIEICKDLSVQENLVIATSGNIVENDLNMLYFRENDPQTVVVYMQTDIEVLVARTITDSKHGKMSGARESLEQLLKQREPLYKRFADVIIETNGKTPREIASQILASLPR